GFLNADMPLIRYRTGDRVALQIPGGGCACGRTLPTLSAVEGRADDVLYTADGRHIGRLDPVFKGQLPMREAQIVQEALDRIRVRYLAAPGFTAEAGHSIVERVQARMGKVEVILERVEKLPRGANGKFRAVICDLSSEDRQRIGQART